MENNRYIIGDNRDVLPELIKEMEGKIKLIYIDPPYNTGKDFIYNDSRSQSEWIDMMRDCLSHSKKLLKEDGFIFISIDNNSLCELLLLGYEVFGKKNHVSNIVWIRRYGRTNDTNHISNSHEYIVVFAKNKKKSKFNLLAEKEEQIKSYQNPDLDERGLWRKHSLVCGKHNNKCTYEIVLPSGRVVVPTSGASWAFPRESFDKLLADNRIYFGKNGDNIPVIKKFLNEQRRGLVSSSIWDDVGINADSKKEILRDFNGKHYFHYPKPIKLIKRIIEIATNNNDIVLDFFSGSGTTAIATMDLNINSNEIRSWIMVQRKEETQKDSIAYKDGYKYISDIAIERIKINIERLNKEYKEKLNFSNKLINFSFQIQES